MNIFSKFFWTCVILLISINLFCTELYNKLVKLPGVVSVEELKTNSFFTEKYLVWFEQPIDWENPNSGTFKQRVFVNHKNYDIPVVYTTEGYSGDYAMHERYTNELCNIINANEIFVEHRFFSKSVPESIDWAFLTTKNVASDHHAIFKALKTLYRDKWVSTGISKGGETCLLYQMYYPADMDATVAYVAPVAKALEDGRHEAFIKNTGTAKDKKKIVDFQKEILKRRETIYPMFESFVKSSNLTFRIPLEEVYDYCVLEFSFAFWQWIGNTERVPTKKDSDDKLFQYLVTVAGPDYFSIEGSASTFPFFYQAARELGYYGYDTAPLEKLLIIDSAEGYFKKIFLPGDMNIEFESQTSMNLEKFLQNRAKNTFLIYGEFDPWTAVAPNVENNKQVLKVIGARGTHSTRIGSLPIEQQQFVTVELLKIMH